MNTDARIHMDGKNKNTIQSTLRFMHVANHRIARSPIARTTIVTMIRDSQWDKNLESFPRIEVQQGSLLFQPLYAISSPIFT